MYQERRKNYFSKVDEQSITILFSGSKIVKTADQYYPFVVNRNFHYLTGLDQENLIVLMIKGNGQSETIVYFDETDELTAKWDGSGYTHSAAQNISLIEQIKPASEFLKDLSSFIEASRRSAYGLINTAYFDVERKSYNLLATQSEAFANDFSKKYPGISIANNFFIISELRLTKDALEIDKMSQAIKISQQAIYHVLKETKVGINESELVAHYKFILNTHGLEESFDTIMGAGINATILHYSDNNQIIEDGDLILMDSGVFYENYASDITRTFPANGKFTVRQKQVYDAVLKVNKEAIEFIKPGIWLSDFQAFGKRRLAEEAIKLGLIKTIEEITKYYFHGLGHYLGQDVHDVGRYDVQFAPGMVITVEPGLYIPEEKTGVRIEDNILVTKTGSINLSKDILKETKDIEKLMKK